MQPEIVVIGRPNPEALRYLLESVLNYLLEQPQVSQAQGEPVTVEKADLVPA
jgi:hypothetical protein